MVPEKAVCPAIGQENDLCEVWADELIAIKRKWLVQFVKVISAFKLEMGIWS